MLVALWVSDVRSWRPTVWTSLYLVFVLFVLWMVWGV